MKKLIIILLLLTQSSYANELIRMIDHNVYNQLENILYTGANPNGKGDNEETALIYASKKENIKAIEILLKYNANVNNIDIASANALHYSARLGNLEISNLLLKADINIDQQDFLGKTPIMRALQHAHTDIALEILNYSPNMLLKNNEGKNILEVAIQYNNIPFFTTAIQNLKIANVTRLERLKQTAKFLDKNALYQLLDKHINSLIIDKAEKEAKLNFTQVNLVNLKIVKIKDFPCHNDEINTSISAEEICLKNFKETYFNITAKKKPIRIISIANTPLLAKQNLQTIKAINNPWLFESFIIKRKPLNSHKIDEAIITTPTENLATNNVNEAKLDSAQTSIIPAIIPKANLISPITAPALALSLNSVDTHSDKSITTEEPKIKANPNTKKPLIINKNKNVSKSEQLGFEKDFLTKNYSIEFVRTNEWLINPSFVPLSIIDQDNLGTDMLFNRKFIYQKAKKKSPASYKKPYIKLNNLEKDKIYIKAKPLNNYFIQLGIFVNPDNAQRLKNKAMQFGNSSILNINSGDKLLKQVVIGPFKSKEGAEQIKMQKNFTEFLGNKALIKKY